jgi:hypothetical protein
MAEFRNDSATQFLVKVDNNFEVLNKILIIILKYA